MCSRVTDFFFQAEDGIRDVAVTGVQTCALPIYRAFQAARDLYTGIVYVNAPTIGAETHLPFGGTKQTGNGHREAAIAAIDFFTEWKTIYIDYSDKLQRAQIDNA